MSNDDTSSGGSLVKVFPIRAQCSGTVSCDTETCCHNNAGVWNPLYSSCSTRCYMEIRIKVDDGLRTNSNHCRNCQCCPQYRFPTFYAVITKASSSADDTDPLIWSRVESKGHNECSLKELAQTYNPTTAICEQDRGRDICEPCTASEAEAMTEVQQKWEPTIRKSIAQLRFSIAEEAIKGVLTGDTENSPCPCGYVKRAAKIGGTWGVWGQSTSFSQSNIGSCGSTCDMHNSCLSFEWTGSTCHFNKYGMEDERCDSSNDSQRTFCLKVKQRYRCGTTIHEFVPNAPTRAPTRAPTTRAPTSQAQMYQQMAAQMSSMMNPRL